MTDNSAMPIPSAPIITGRSRVGRNKPAAVAGVPRLTWQQLAAKREPFAWRAFKRAFRKDLLANAVMYGYEWEWFIEGWKARTRNEPIKSLIKQLRFWGDPRV